MRTITKRELNTTIEKHKLWLESNPKGEQADLSNCILSNLDLSYVNLSNANLYNADLSNTNLRRAELHGVKLLDANLRNANLQYTNLSSARLYNANLYNANLKNTDLRGVNLSFANLSLASLSFANLSHAVLTFANLTETDLYNANLYHTNLEKVDLTNLANFNFLLNETIIDKKYYQLIGIGSRGGITTYCVEDNRVFYGYWNDCKGGSLEEFEERIEEVYGKCEEEPDKKYYNEYKRAINYFKECKKDENI